MENPVVIAQQPSSNQNDDDSNNNNNFFEKTTEEDKFEDEYELFLERQSMGSVVSELDLLRRRLARRNALMTEVIKCYHTDVIYVKDELIRLEKKNPDLYEIATQVKHRLPSIDLRPIINIYSPEECFMRLKPCAECGGTIEIVHHESDKLQEMKRMLKEAIRRETEGKQLVLQYKAENLRDNETLKRTILKAEQDTMIFENKISELKKEAIQFDPNLIKQLKKQVSILKNEMKISTETMKKIPILEEKVSLLTKELDDKTVEIVDYESHMKLLYKEKGTIENNLSTRTRVCDKLDQQLSAEKKETKKLKDVVRELEKDVEIEKERYDRSLKILEESRKAEMLQKDKISVLEEELSEAIAKEEELIEEAEELRENIKDVENIVKKAEGKSDEKIKKIVADYEKQIKDINILNDGANQMNKTILEKKNEDISFLEDKLKTMAKELVEAKAAAKKAGGGGGSSRSKSRSKSPKRNGAGGGKKVDAISHDDTTNDGIDSNDDQDPQSTIESRTSATNSMDTQTTETSADTENQEGGASSSSPKSAKVSGGYGEDTVDAEGNPQRERRNSSIQVDFDDPMIAKKFGAAKEKIEDLQTKISVISIENEDLTMKIEELEESKAKYKEKSKSQNEKIEQYETQIEDLKKQKIELSKKMKKTIDDQEDIYQRRKAEEDEIQKTLGTMDLDAKLKALREEFEDENNEIKESKKMLVELMQQKLLNLSNNIISIEKVLPVPVLVNMGEEQDLSTDYTVQKISGKLDARMNFTMADIEQTIVEESQWDYVTQYMLARTDILAQVTTESLTNLTKSNKDATTRIETLELTVERANLSIEELEKQLKLGNQANVQKEGKKYQYINELEGKVQKQLGELSANEVQISKLTLLADQLEPLNDKVKTMKKIIQEKDTNIALLVNQVNEKEATVKTKSKQIETQNTIALEKEEEINTLNTNIINHIQNIQTLEKEKSDITEKHDKIVEEDRLRLATNKCIGLQFSPELTTTDQQTEFECPDLLLKHSVSLDQSSKPQSTRMNGMKVDRIITADFPQQKSLNGNDLFTKSFGSIVNEASIISSSNESSKAKTSAASMKSELYEYANPKRVGTPIRIIKQKSIVKPGSLKPLGFFE